MSKKRAITVTSTIFLYKAVHITVYKINIVLLRNNKRIFIMNMRGNFQRLVTRS